MPWRPRRIHNHEPRPRQALGQVGRCDPRHQLAAWPEQAAPVIPEGVREGLREIVGRGRAQSCGRIHARRVERERIENKPPLSFSLGRSLVAPEGAGVDRAARVRVDGIGHKGGLHERDGYPVHAKAIPSARRQSVPGFAA